MNMKLKKYLEEIKEIFYVGRKNLTQWKFMRNIAEERFSDIINNKQTKATYNKTYDFIFALTSSTAITPSRFLSHLWNMLLSLLECPEKKQPKSFKTDLNPFKAKENWILIYWSLLPHDFVCNLKIWRQTDWDEIRLFFFSFFNVFSDRYKKVIGRCWPTNQLTNKLTNRSTNRADTQRTDSSTDQLANH